MMGLAAARKKCSRILLDHVIGIGAGRARAWAQEVYVKSRTRELKVY